MDAKMHSKSAQIQSDAMQADFGNGALADAGVHVDHLLAMLAEVQSDAQALRTRVVQSTTRADGGQRQEATALRDALQQSLQQLRGIQGELAAQQTRLDSLTHAGGSTETTVSQLGAKARLADTLRAHQTEDQAHKGARARAQLHTAPAAGSGLGEGGMGSEMPNVVQMPGGEREGLDGIVTMVGGMLRAAAAPTVAGKQAKTTGWQAQPESAPLAQLQDRWGRYVKQQVQSRKSPENMDINQLIQWVMREAYIGNTQDLRAHATRVEYYTQLKQQLREELNRAREFRSRHRAGEGDAAKLDEPFDKQHITLDPNVSPDGHWAVRALEPDGTTDSLEDMDAYIKKLDNSLSTVGDDGQAAQLDLQNLSQKQAQLLNMLSNLSKAMHDTAMSILRKIGN